MLLKWILVLFAVLKFAYNRITTTLIWKQRSKPLPESVAHIYDTNKYQEFLSYKKEYRKINFITDVISLGITSVLYLSDFYTLFDISNPYLSVAMFFIVLFLINIITDLPVSYYETFYIEDKYGLNHKTKKEFFKETLINESFSLLATCIVLFVLVFICENISNWTHSFEITYTQSFVFCLLIAGAFFVISLILSCISLLVLRTQYTFTEMEDGPLKNKILEYTKESKKKIKHIKVYNESKKSNSKNAFLLKLLWYREFGIADNFLDGNSEEELLAVLLHEVGHLKHKKNIWNYLNIFILIIIFCLFVWLIPNAQFIVEINNWINQSFGLIHTNYYLSFTVFITFLSPLIHALSIYRNFVSCKEEKEADFNSVDKGYGQALIDTFSKLSEDELIDVNPHPLIEVLEYDHPGMARRIEYIQARMAENNIQLN